MLFQKNILKKYADAAPQETVAQAWQQYKQYFLNPEIQENIRQSKEEQFQEGFLRELFVKVLGYTLNPSPDYNLITEQKNETNSKKADGAILVDGKVVGVIELKDHKTTDLSKIEQQAFGYKNQNQNAVYVVISNFEKLRFYIDNAVECVEFDLFHLTENEFSTLWICLAWPNIAANLPKRIKAESVSSEDAITNALYRDYTAFKQILYQDIIKNNSGDAVELYKKTQKLLDRLLFIFFAEDGGLLPPNTMVKIIADWEKLAELDEYQPLYNRIKKYFGYLDTGYRGKDYEIFAYNGGLFKPDEVLDNLVISDDVLAAHTRRLSEYDYKSEVDVNILGHIFENSLNEIENVENQSVTESAPTTTTKRKRDGVFYTPQYITKYIVENTVGRLCTDKKAELQINEQEYFADKQRKSTTKKALVEKLDAYRQWLSQITICDPACGSGAFLNAALNFLIAEHRLVDEMEAKVLERPMVIPQIENSILENNLFGVDINEESVEIAKLSLWLRTAKPHRKLNSLNKNIKCGNSLISDPEVAADKAFDWQAEFPQVFERGGFDVVIGNPPYVRVQNLKTTEVDFYFDNYQCPSGKLDISILFFEQGYNLLNSNGLLSYISTSQWMQTDYGKNIRNYLSDGKLKQILDFGSLPVFEDADTYPAIFSISKKHSQTIEYARVKEKEDLSIERLKAMAFVKLNCDDFSSEPWQFSELNLIKTLENKGIEYQLLKEIAPSFIGDLTGKDEAFVLTLEKAIKLGLEKEILYPYAYRGEEVASYQIVTPKSVVIYPYKENGELFSVEYFLNNYPNAFNYLISFKEDLMKRQDSRKFYAFENNWFRHLRPGQFSYIKPAKILLKGIGTRLQAGFLSNHSVFNGANVPAIVLPDDRPNIDKILLCLLNSKVATYYLTSICPKKLGGYYRFNSSNISSIPIVLPKDPQPFIALADKMLTLNGEMQQKVSRFLRRITETYNLEKTTATLETFYTLSFSDFVKELGKQKLKLTLVQKDELEDYFNAYQSECQSLKTAIATTDHEIDRMVYALYGLTDEEVKVVEK